jgi:hypothetical protein
VLPQTRPVPMNSEARRVVEAWALGRKNDFVFYNHDTGKPFVDLKAGFALVCRKAGFSGVTHSTVMVTMRYTHTNLDSKRPQSKN